jgi:molybdopterin/thiamine biosynthesis adenylyltransferase
MNQWDEAAQAAREAFLEELNAAGFAVRSSSKAEGDVEFNGRPVPVDILIPDGFPYEPPKVKAIDGLGGLSWHADRDGFLCLWARSESGSLPWRTTAQVVERVQQWFARDAEGWKDDTPDLDLERYWDSSLDLVVYPDLDRLVGRVNRLTQKGRIWTVKAQPPLKGKKQFSCLVFDVGELAMPIRTVDQVLEAVEDAVPSMAGRVRSGAIRILMIRYWRSGNAGVLTLLAGSEKRLTFTTVQSAHEGDSTLQLRSGPDRDAVCEKKVAIVGVGAIGSQVADLLGRAGVGLLTLIDYDIVRPGNLIRHTASARDIGAPKVEVVKRLVTAGPAKPEVDVREEMVTNIEQATALLMGHELVVDAAADQSSTRLLLDGARELGRSVVTVSLVREGQVARVDRAPLCPGEAHAPVMPSLPASARLVEGGCGDPVSPAPMWAATTAAAHAVGMSMDLLTGRNEYPPTLLAVLVAGDRACGDVGSRR